MTPVQRGETWDMSIDGVPCGFPGDPHPNAFASPDGTQITCAVRRGRTWFVGVNGVAGRSAPSGDALTSSP